MRTALEPFDAAERICLQNLRRRHPGESEDQIAERLAAWLHTRSGAENGDGIGRPTDRSGKAG